MSMLIIGCGQKRSVKELANAEATHKLVVKKDKVKNLPVVVDSVAIKKKLQEQLEELIYNRAADSLIERVIYAGADVSYKDENGFYPLYWANYYQNRASRIPKLLIKHGARDYNAELKELFDCCQNGNIAKLKELVADGADINAKRVWFDPEEMDETCNCYETPIIYAIKSGSIDLVSYLIGQGALLNFNDQGVQPIFVAMQERQYSIAELLIENGAKKCAKFALSGGYYEFVGNDTIYLNYIIEKEYPYSEYYGKSPITKAADDGNLCFVKKMSGIVDSIQINRALAQARNREIASFLIKEGGRVDYEFTYDEPEGIFYTTPLINAVGEKDLELVKFLIAKGAPINQQDSLNMNGFVFPTALAEAVRSESYDIAKYLIEQGANIDYFDIEYDIPYNPLALAVEHNNLQLVELLLAAGAKTEFDAYSIFDRLTSNTDSAIVKLLKQSVP